MLPNVVIQLKTGPITNVTEFGSSDQFEPPYVVVKPEPDIAGRGRALRVIAHFLPDQQDWLEDYVTNTLPDLLDGFIVTSRHGARNQLEIESPDSDITVQNDDGTISMERVFLLPSSEYIRR